MKRISFNVKDKRVEEVLDALPKGEMTQYITNCILEHIQRSTVGEAYSYNITDKRVIEILEQIPKGERTQFVTNSILSCMYLAKQRAKERAEHKEVRIKVE